MAPAARLWAAGIAAFLTVDAVLVRRGDESASEWFRRHALACDCALVYLILHFHGRPRALAPFDPLAFAARKLRGI